MVTSIILINVERTKINEVAAQLVEFDEISEVYSVSGKYDLIAIVRVKTNDDLSRLVTAKLRIVENITATETMLAFQAYSRHDLDAMFSVGLDN
jgi:DNA-binding Lrp family transcriptional regulator